MNVNIWKTKKYHKFGDHWHYTGKHGGAAHSICNLKYSAPKKILIVFQDWSNYDHHFVMKELAENLKNNLLDQEKILKKTEP